MRENPVDPRRVYVAGLSAGGAAAAIMARAYPDLYAAVGVHSGLACGAAHDLPSALMAMRQGGGSPRANRHTARVVPTIVLHGDQDTTVHPRNGDAVIARRGRIGLAGNDRARPGAGRPRPQPHASTPIPPATSCSSTGRSMAPATPGPAAARPGSYTDPRGPDAAREMLRFFLAHPHPSPGQAG